MSSPSLGRLEPVPLRSVWPHEAHAFTPWLAQPDHLALLGDVIGLELELEGVEQSVGPFSADLLCRDTVTGERVLVENQIERTDHTHLGQLVTYAAGLEAVRIVWIAARFTEEHRAALDWLNAQTGEGVDFFGLEIELWRIGDSPPAPRFNVVARPNDWARRVRQTAAAAELSDERREHLAYWTAFNALLAEEGGPVRPRRPTSERWAEYAVGRSGFGVGVSRYVDDDALSAWLSITGPNAVAFFEQLQAERGALEAELGASLVWDHALHLQSRSIIHRWGGEPSHDRTAWPAQHGRLKERLEAFHSVFAARVRALQALVVEDEARDGSGRLTSSEDPAGEAG